MKKLDEKVNPYVVDIKVKYLIVAWSKPIVCPFGKLLKMLIVLVKM